MRQIKTALRLRNAVIVLRYSRIPTPVLSGSGVRVRITSISAGRSQHPLELFIVTLYIVIISVLLIMSIELLIILLKNENLAVNGHDGSNVV